MLAVIGISKMTWPASGTSVTLLRSDLGRGSICTIKLCVRIAHPLPVLNIAGPTLLAPANPTNQRSFAVISVPILLVAAEETSLGCVERLEHEYALEAERDTDWAARPVALTHDISGFSKNEIKWC
jgi:hypothetical protein